MNTQTKVREYKKRLRLKIVTEFNATEGDTTAKVDSLADKYHLSPSTIYNYIRKSK